MKRSVTFHKPRAACVFGQDVRPQQNLNISSTGIYSSLHRLQVLRGRDHV